MGLNPGDLVERYRIVGLLGSGGMGDVYHAFDTRLQRNVALKLLHPPKEGDESVGRGGTSPTSSRGSARMLREARAAALLEHPNVVHVYDVGELESPEELRGSAYLAMELIKGRSLRAVMADRTTPLRERIRWVADVARALSAAHSQGLVHRDIKPENVMLRQDGVIKVLDFGIAKRASYGQVDPSLPTEEPQIVPTLTTKGVAIGTPYYMAPEQMRGDTLDGRADQFSWGVLAYELLTGAGPWRTDTDALGLVSQVLSKPVASPSGQNPEIPLRVAQAIVRALAKDREDRFPSMEALLAEVDETAAEAHARTEEAAAAPALLDAESRKAPTLRSAPPPALPRRQTRRTALAMGLALAVGAAAAAVGALRRGPAIVTPAASGATDAARAALGCASNAACIAAHSGEAFRCRPDTGACAPLTSSECVVRAEPGDVAREDTVWVGTVFDGDDFKQRGVDLARRDFAAMPRVMPASGGNVQRRPIAIIECSPKDGAASAVKHLVEEVGVPAVVGFRGSQEAIELLTSALVPRHVLTIVAANTSSQITSIRTPAELPRLILRTTNNTAQMGQALATFFGEVVEPRLRAERKRPLRVALLRANNTGGLGFSDAIVSTMRFNGGSVQDNQPLFTELVVTSDTDAVAAGIRERLTTARPDVVLYYGSDFNTSILAPTEASWPGNQPKPVYLSGLPLDALEKLGRAPGISKRLFGVTSPSNTQTNVKFTLHYNATFSDAVSATVSPATEYDAFYVLAYATYSLGDKPITGESLAGAVKRLVGGSTRIEVGPARILEALGILGSGGNIDLQGAASDLDFDATGESPTDHVVICLGKDLAGAPIGIESGLTWDARTGKLRGAMKCP